MSLHATGRTVAADSHAGARVDSPNLCSAADGECASVWSVDNVEGKIRCDRGQRVSVVIFYLLHCGESTCVYRLHQFTHQYSLPWSDSRCVSLRHPPKSTLTLQSEEVEQMAPRRTPLPGTIRIQSLNV